MKEKEEYNEWYHKNYIKIDQLILLFERKEYEFCKLTFKKFNDGEFKNENELNNYILSILKSHSRENIISKIVSFQGIINLLATNLNEFDKDDDTSFNGYLILEQYHSMAVRIEKLAREAMVEIAFSEASQKKELLISEREIIEQRRDKINYKLKNKIPLDDEDRKEISLLKSDRTSNFWVFSIIILLCCGIIFGNFFDTKKHTEVQDPYKINSTIGSEISNIDLDFSSYSNPTNSNIFLNVRHPNNGKMKYQLYNLNHKLLKSDKINSINTTIDMSKYPVSTYVLTVTNGTTIIKGFKIIKNELQSL